MDGKILSLDGVADDAGHPMDTMTGYLDCLAWPFLGVVSTSAASIYLAFRDVHNGELRSTLVFEAW